MKRFIIYAAIVVAAAFALQPQTTAFASGGSITIKGNVKNGNAPVKNTPVNITANGKPLPTPTTDDQGNYSVKTDDTAVPPNSTIVVTVDQDGDGAPEARIEFKAKGGDDVIIANIVINSTNIPEFGWLGGAAAGGIGLGLVAWQRRRLKTR